MLLWMGMVKEHGMRDIGHLTISIEATITWLVTSE